MFGDPVTNPMGWEMKEFNAFADTITYGTGSPPPYQLDGIPFVRATNIKQGTVLRDGMVYISEDDAKRISRCRIKAGNLIVVRSGINSGDCGLIPDIYDGAYAAYDLIVEIKFPYNYYCNFLINSPFGKTQLSALTRRAGQPHLNAEQLRSLNIPNLPMELIIKFTERIKETEKLQRHQAESSRQSEQLFQTLLARAFS